MTASAPLLTYAQQQELDYDKTLLLQQIDELIHKKRLAKELENLQSSYNMDKNMLAPNASTAAGPAIRDQSNESLERDFNQYIKN